MSLGKRVATAAVGIPLFGAALWKGGDIWAVSAFVISAAAGSAALSMALSRQEKKLFSISGLTALAGILIMGYWFFGQASGRSFLFPPDMAVVFWALLLGLSLMTWKEPKGVGEFLGACFISQVFTLFMGSFLVNIRFLDQGIWKMGALLLAVWAFDTGGYFVGSSIGKRPLHPFSPKKSWEGTIGGAVCSMLVCLGLSRLWGGWPIPIWSPAALGAGGASWVWPMIFGLGVSLVSQVGDLFESALKRDWNVKDSSRLLPGHGGFYDRFDSLFFAAPAAFWLLS